MTTRLQFTFSDDAAAEDLIAALEDYRYLTREAKDKKGTAQGNAAKTEAGKTARRIGEAIGGVKHLVLTPESL